MLLRIVAILFPLFAIAALGYVIGRQRQPDMAHANQLNMDVFVPALVFAAMTRQGFHVNAHWPLLFATFVVIAGSGVAGWAIARTLGMAPKTLVPTLMFNNCGNLGLPLAVLAFGEQALAPAVVMFVVSNIMHFSFGSWYLNQQMAWSSVWKSPTVIASVAGLAVNAAGWSIWPPLLTAIKMVGDISIPLMLFALGVRLAQSQIQAMGIGVLGATLRPVVGMVLAWGTATAMQLPAQEQALLLVFGALPPAVLNYMFAERYQQEPEKVASMVLVGNVAALLFLPVALALALP